MRLIFVHKSTFTKYEEEEIMNKETNDRVTDLRKNKVALYLRGAKDDDSTWLHQVRLNELIKTYGWDYTLYQDAWQSNQAKMDLFKILQQGGTEYDAIATYSLSHLIGNQSIDFSYGFLRLLIELNIPVITPRRTIAVSELAKYIIPIDEIYDLSVMGDR
jgi:hypothetical protein